MTKELRPNEYIETPRLILKRRALDQAAELFALVDKNRKHLRAWMPWEEETVSEDDTTDFIKSCVNWWKAGEAFEYSVHEKSSGKMIGGFGLHSVKTHKRSCDLGFWICKEHEGKGYISECVQIGEDIARAQRLHRVVITCDARNNRSASVAIRNGFLKEAHQLDETYERGQYRDTLRFYKILNHAVEGAVTDNLPEGYSIREVQAEEFWEIVGDLPSTLFDEREMVLRPAETITEAEQARLKEINKDFKWNYSLYVVVMRDQKLAGWSWGVQDHRDSFFMLNSAVLPDHRGRGLYSRLLDEVVRILTDKGYQRIVSRHAQGNNAILIPKLKKGFLITGMEMNDVHGSLLHMTYYTNPLRRRIFDFRTGHLRPDAQMKKLLKI